MFWWLSVCFLLINLLFRLSVSISTHTGWKLALNVALPHTILSNLPVIIISAWTLQYLFPCCLQKSIACGVQFFLYTSTNFTVYSFAQCGLYCFIQLLCYLKRRTFEHTMSWHKLFAFTVWPPKALTLTWCKGFLQSIQPYQQTSIRGLQVQSIHLCSLEG